MPRTIGMHHFYMPHHYAPDGVYRLSWKTQVLFLLSLVGTLYLVGKYLKPDDQTLTQQRKPYAMLTFIVIVLAFLFLGIHLAPELEGQKTPIVVSLLVIVVYIASTTNLTG